MLRQQPGHNSAVTFAASSNGPVKKQWRTAVTVPDPVKIASSITHGEEGLQGDSCHIFMFGWNVLIECVISSSERMCNYDLTTGFSSGD